MSKPNRIQNYTDYGNSVEISKEFLAYLQSTRNKVIQSNVVILFTPIARSLYFC